MKLVQDFSSMINLENRKPGSIIDASDYFLFYDHNGELIEWLLKTRTRYVHHGTIYKTNAKCFITGENLFLKSGYKLTVLAKDCGLNGKSRPLIAYFKEKQFLLWILKSSFCHDNF